MAPMIRALAIAMVLMLAAPAAAAEHWRPVAGASFSIILSVAPASVTPPAQVVDLDLFETRASVVAALKRQGKRVVCYFSAGSWENWRSDKGRFPRSVIGRPIDGWPGERYVDIRQVAALAPIMRARLDLCKRKGFDGADPDNVDSWGAVTGFPLHASDAVRYVRFLAREAHARGLAVGLKNAPEIASTVMPAIDFAVTEDCFKLDWCRRSRNFIADHKPVFAIEYTDNRIDFAAFCQEAARLGLSPIYKRRNLDEWERRCRP
jgi:hypothetical protein